MTTWNKRVYIISKYSLKNRKNITPLILRVFSNFHVGLIFLWIFPHACNEIIGLTDWTRDLEKRTNWISSTISPDTEKSKALEYLLSMDKYFSSLLTFIRASFIVAFAYVSLSLEYERQNRIVANNKQDISVFNEKWISPDKHIGEIFRNIKHFLISRKYIYLFLFFIICRSNYFML